MASFVERTQGEAVHRNAPGIVLLKDSCAAGPENELGRKLGVDYMVSLCRDDSQLAERDEPMFPARGSREVR